MGLAMQFWRFSFFFFSLVFFQSPSFAQNNADLHEASSELFREIWSPYCSGISLLECPSGNAQILRDELRARLQAGATKEQLLQEVYARFGKSRLQMEPPVKGRGGLAYALPWIALALAGLGVGIFLKKHIRKAPKVTPRPEAPRAVDPRILKDLEDRL